MITFPLLSDKHKRRKLLYIYIHMPGEMSRGRTSGSRTKTLPLIKCCTAMEALIDFFREWSFKKKGNTGTGNIDKFNFYRRAVALNSMNGH